ncbi:hypothetical protein L6R53_06910 [Myxococcota bacterium]|nr:hypothetical protein [Myxococcota bacterium]
MLWLLLSCAPPPAADPGPDPARVERMVAAWPQAPAEVEAELRQVQDPLERLSLVVAVSEAWPGTTRALCATLDPADRERCLALNERPHLHQPTPGAKGLPPPEGRGDPGGLVDRLARLGALGPAASGPPREAGCATDPDPRGCRQRTAAAAEPPDAVAICAAEDDPRWRDECVFRASELPLVEAAGPRAPEGAGPGDPLVAAAGRAGSLCLAAGAFRAQCLQHVGGRLGAVAPPAGASGDLAWGRLGQAISACAQAVEAHAAEVGAPGLGPLVEDKLWATVLWMAVDHGEVAAGAAAADLPPAAWPHLRCALAERLVAEGRPADEPLDAAQAALGEALARHDPAGRPGRKAYEVASTWSPQAPALPHLPRVHYLADPVRLRSADDADDARSCLVEAGPRASPPRRAWLPARARSTDPAAVATAERLARAPLPGEVPTAGPQPTPTPPPRRPRGRGP